MEAPIDVATLGSKDHMNIVKGKRTKRSRPQSPIPFVVACNNSMYNEGNRGEVLEGIPIPNVETKNCGQYLLPPSPSFSSSFSFELYQDNTTTEEEEDMANCLILLAQGRPRESAMSRGGDHRHDVGITCNKFNSRKFMETASNGTGKVGYYVYECKTCNRTFPSFQALGGHRASHKKPKTMAPFEAAIVDEKNIRQLKATYEGPNSKNNNVRGLNGNNNNKVKVHECSMCGAEFTSGQALGGHMRRHRGSIGSNVNVITTNTNLSLTVPMAIESEKPKKSRNILSLSMDLNLPAPEDDHRVSKFDIPSQQHHQQQQQSSLVFSTPTLVDCHY